MIQAGQLFEPLLIEPFGPDSEILAKVGNSAEALLIEPFPGPEPFGPDLL